nr:hypothetical protein [Burkholderia stagnalis]
MPAREVGHGRAEQLRTDFARQAHAQPALQAGLLGRKRIERFVEHIEHRPAPLEQQPARVGQRQAARVPLDQARRQARLQLRDMPADIGMASTYIRLVAASSVSAAFPAPDRRTGFSALQTAATHFGTTLAFALGAWMLDGHAVTRAGIAPLLWACLVGSLALPAYLWWLRAHA